MIKASGESCPEGTDGTCNLGVCRSYDGQCKNILGTSYYHGLCRRKQESSGVCGELLCQRRGSRDDTSCVTAASLLVAPVGGEDAKDDLTSQVADGTECRRYGDMEERERQKERKTEKKAEMISYRSECLLDGWECIRVP